MSPNEEQPVTPNLVRSLHMSPQIRPSPTFSSRRSTGNNESLTEAKTQQSLGFIPVICPRGDRMQQNAVSVNILICVFYESA